MIQANELRIGNYLYSNLTKGNFICTARDIKYINEECNVADPIPLTPEILEKCGFEKDQNDHTKLFLNLWDKYNALVYIWHIDQLRIESISQDVIQVQYLSTIKHPKYLHQLQNLYYALTGEELTVNL